MTTEQECNERIWQAAVKVVAETSAGFSDLTTAMRLRKIHLDIFGTPTKTPPDLARIRGAVEDLQRNALIEAGRIFAANGYRHAGHTQKFAEGRADMARVVLAIIDKELNP